MTPKQKKVVSDYFDAIGLKDIPKSEEKTMLIKSVIKYATDPITEKVAMFYPMIGNLPICPKDKRKIWNETGL